MSISFHMYSLFPGYLLFYFFYSLIYFYKLLICYVVTGKYELWYFKNQSIDLISIDEYINNNNLTTVL